MKKQQLTFRIHDPNPTDVTAKHVLKILIEVNWDKARDAILAASLQQQDEEQISGSEK